MQGNRTRALTAALALGILFGPRLPPTGADQEAIPQTSMAGISGLVRIPSADVLPHGSYAAGVNVVDGKHRYYWGPNTVAHFVAVGIIPRVEVVAGILNHDGNLGVQRRERLPWGPGGWNFDRMFSAHALVVPQTSRCPVSLAVGAQDLAGTGYFRASYVVATRRWSGLGLHAGVSDGVLGPIFAGIDYRPARALRVMLDHDGNRLNFGLTLQTRRFSITPILTGLSALGGGVTYTQRL